MKILIINPPISGEERYGKFSEAGGYGAPLGLCYIGAVLEKEGHKVIIIDAEAENLNFSQLKRKIQIIRPDIVCLTASTTVIYRAFTILKIIKELNKDIITVLGGPHISAVPEETIKSCKYLDYGVMGEGEETIKELVKTLEKGRDVKKIDGIIYRKKNKTIRNKPRALIKDLDTIPFPARHLLKDFLKKYRPNVQTYKKLPVITLMTSRGCPFKCSFCDKSIFGNTVRFRSVDNVIAEVEHLIARYGCKELSFQDDTFTINKKKTIELCNRLKDYGLPFTIPSRVDVLDREVLRVLKRAGCWQISMGIESGNQRVLDLMGKGVTLQQIRKAVIETDKAGIQAKGFFMLGNAGETISTMKQTIKFATSLPLSQVVFTITTPYPSTKLYEQANKYGTLEKGDWSKYYSWGVTFVPYGLTKDIIKKYHALAYKRFYLRPRLILKLLGQIENFDDIKRYLSSAKVLFRL